MFIKKKLKMKLVVMKRKPQKRNKKNRIKFASFLLSMLPNWIINIEITDLQETIIYIKPEYLHSFFFFLKNYQGSKYDQCINITAVDYPQKKKRFEIVYELRSIFYDTKIRIKTIISEIEQIESISDIYKSALWFERELWDMYGILIKNHPDMRRILTDYCFVGHPLRKDFPLSGFYELNYLNTEKKIVKCKVDLTQSNRYFFKK